MKSLLLAPPLFNFLGQVNFLRQPNPLRQISFLLQTLLLASFVSFFFNNSVYSASLTAGSKSVGIKLGSASSGSEHYTVAGASLQYFALDNLAVGAAYEYWFSGNPTISKASLQSTYYIPFTAQIKPYIGVLYSHYFVEDRSDIDAYGYRLGVAYIKSPMILSAGIKQERYTSNRPVYFDQDPKLEFMVGLSF